MKLMMLAIGAALPFLAVAAPAFADGGGIPFIHANQAPPRFYHKSNGSLVAQTYQQSNGAAPAPDHDGGDPPAAQTYQLPTYHGGGASGGDENP